MRNRFVMLADLVGICVAGAGAFVLRFDWFLGSRDEEFWPFLALALAVKPPVFFLFGLYSRYWRFASVRELQETLLATSTASVLVGVAIAAAIFIGVLPGFPRSVVIIDWMLTVAWVGGFRLSVRVVGEARSGGTGARSATPGRRLLIAGAGHAGIRVARELQRSASLGTPVGFLDDDPIKVGKHIAGIPVVGPLDSLEAIVRSHRVTDVIIAMPSAEGDVVRRLTRACEFQNARFLIMPSVFELLNGKVSVNRLRQVEVADLLRRRPVASRPRASSYLTGRTVAITGGGGGIGLELCRQVVASSPARLALIGHGENSIFEAEMTLRETFPGASIESVIADVRDRSRLGRVLGVLRPDVVFHTAAHKHVPLMEANPEEAITNNVAGTRNVVQVGLDVGVPRLILVSTDKAVAPRSIMGASKRVAELLVRQAAVEHGVAYSVVRFGNVLGSRGSVVPIFQRQIAAGGPVTVTDPRARRFFMTIPEAVHLTIEAGGMAAGGELFALRMGEPVLITDLANDLIRLSGHSPDDFPIEFTGLRPGEKLDEQLWDPDATVTASEHPDVVRIAEEPPVSWARLHDLTEEIIAAAASGDVTTMLARLGVLVPTVATPAEAHRVPHTAREGDARYAGPVSTTGTEPR